VVVFAKADSAAASQADSGRFLQLLLLTVVVAAGAYARAAIGPLQEAMAKAVPLSDNQIALLQGPALALPVVAAAIPLGMLVDRLSRVRLLLFFALGNLVGSVLTGLASTLAPLLAARALVGLTATATPIAAYSLVADIYAPTQRGRSNMVMAVGQAAAIAAAFAIGGALLAVSSSGLPSWRWAILWMSSPLVPVLFAVLALREPQRLGDTVERPSVRQSWVELWRYRAVIVPLLAGLVTVEISVGATVVWAAPALSRHFALAPDRSGGIMAVALFTSGLLGPILGGVLADVCQRTGGPRRTVSVVSGLTLLSAPLGLFAIAPTVGTASALLVVFNTVVNAIAVVVTTLSTVVIPNELRGLFLSVLSAVGMTFAFVLAPLIVSSLSGILGVSGTIGMALSLVCVTTSLLGATTFAAGRGRFPSPAS